MRIFLKLSDYRVKTAFGLFFIALLSISVFFDTWSSIVETWYHSKSYNHGFIIVPISLWLCWTLRNTFINLRPKISWLALIAFIPLGFLWLVADLVHVQVIKQFAVVGMLISGFWVILGNRISSIILFPLGFLFFMVPVGDDLIAPLMEFTATFTVYLIRLTGIPVFRDGFSLSLPSGNWSVVEACSGINYLIASITLGCVYAYITYTRTWKRALFMLAASIVPVLANGFRAFIIVMIGHLSDMALAVGVDHLVYGALFFGLVMMVLFYVGSFWKDPPKGQTQYLSRTQQGTVATLPNQSFFLALLIVGFVNVIWPMSSGWLAKQQQKPITSGLYHYNAVAEKNWQPTDDPEWGWSPHFNGATTESTAYYLDGQFVFGFYQASFEQESQEGGELVNSKNLLVIPEHYKRWKTVQAGTTQLTGNTDKPLLVGHTILGGIERNLVILRWYQIGKHSTANNYRAKWLQLIKRFSKDSSSESQVILFAEAPRDDYQQAQSSLKKIAQRLLE